MTKNNFISKVVNDLLDEKFSVLFLQEKSFNSCGGLFNGCDKEFIVAMGNRLGFEVLVHEYNHFLQWKDERKRYDSLSNGNAIISDWLGGKFFKKSIIAYATEQVIELEWDCERRSIEMIKKYKLDIDLDDYIRSANSYIFFYHAVKKTRVWATKPLYKKALLKTMPTELMDLEYYLDENNISKKQLKKYIGTLNHED